MVTKDEGRLFIAGMINVMLNKDRLRALDKCSFGNDKIAEDVQKIQEVFTDIIHITNAIGAVGNIIKSLPAELMKCPDHEIEINQILTWSKQFDNPIMLAASITMNLAANAAQVAVHHAGMLSYMKGGQYDVAGEEYGRILIMILGPVSGNVTDPNGTLGTHTGGRMNGNHNKKKDDDVPANMFLY